VPDPTKAWRWWVAGTVLGVAAFVATPSEVDNGDVCPRPPAWLLVHPESEMTGHEFFDLGAYCNDHARKRGAAGFLVAVAGTGLAIRSHRRLGKSP
jgi:hypothetical protein